MLPKTIANILINKYKILLLSWYFKIAKVKIKTNNITYISLKVITGSYLFVLYPLTLINTVITLREIYVILFVLIFTLAILKYHDSKRILYLFISILDNITYISLKVITVLISVSGYKTNKYELIIATFWFPNTFTTILYNKITQIVCTVILTNPGKISKGLPRK